MRERDGIVRAIRTPAIVAWTPELKKQNHTAVPTNAYGMGDSIFRTLKNTNTSKRPAPRSSHPVKISEV
jgi:hypothetical protein